MKKHIYFNLADKPANMGQSQMVEAHELDSFLKERKELIPNAKIVGNKLTFTKENGKEGFAIITDVPDEFQN
ncbi:MAG: hypothetical protein EKK61_04050 [Rickettsiales bacterium]|nr:MAG: hypothetical protein EKK61_04050 [Rickettsiales bacterium]